MIRGKKNHNLGPRSNHFCQFLYFSLAKKYVANIDYDQIIFLNICSQILVGEVKDDAFCKVEKFWKR